MRRALAGSRLSILTCLTDADDVASLRRALLRALAYSVERQPGGYVALNPAAPHWIATDERGLQVLGRLDGRTPLGEVVTSSVKGV